MAFKCIIVDDEELARRLLANHLSQLDGYELMASCQSAIEANKILKKQNIDLMFLDIEMPVLKGVDFLKNLTNKPKVIFTTAYRDYAVEGFDLDAVDYLLKPISFARFFKGIEKFESLHLKAELGSAMDRVFKDFIFIRKDRKQVKLFLENILYVEGLKDYIKIHTETETHVIKHGLTSFHDLLDDRFLRTHRSYVVNRHKITAFTALDVELDNIEIPIGERYKKLALERLNG